MASLLDDVLISRVNLPYRERIFALDLYHLLEKKCLRDFRGVNALDMACPKKDTTVDVLELSREMVEVGVRRLIYTDIKRDGTLTEPDFNMVGRLIAEVDVPVIASGGISKLEHLGKLKEIGAEGAIIGKALYTGDLNLTEAMLSVS